MTATAETRARLDRMMEAYEPPAGPPDACLDAGGRLRPAWRRFFERFTALPGPELARRTAGADRHMRETGVTYRAYGDAQERPWPLSPVPLLIEADEWAGIAAGVAQRARLMETVLADLFGPAALVRDGRVPAAAVAGNPDFLHPLVGVTPAGGRYLSLYAADLGRGPDGRWRVLGDRTQAPSGAGYALENRLALSRGFADLYGAMQVERLAPFFQAFREGLTQLAERVEPRVGLLTPGPHSETYFEHAYLARYLGFLLVEGGDLVVRDGRVHVRTVAGLKRIDVILRRIDADFADPLELNGRSRLGVPGLMEAVRNGRVAVANALGSGLVEARALTGLMPALAPALLGEDLLLPGLATAWGGDPEAPALLGRPDAHLSGAFRDPMPGLDRLGPVRAGDLTEAEHKRLHTLLARRGLDYAAQDHTRLATMPVWNGTRLVPRPFTLRVFAAATRDGWHVMPGGFCRVADRPDASAIAMGEGVQSADVWVLSDRPVEAVTLLPSTGSVRIRRLTGNLPSRAADNLFWLGRYLERTEATLRVLRCLATRRIEVGAPTADASPDAGTTPSLAKLVALLRRWGALPEPVAGTATPLRLALSDDAQYGSALALAREVRRTASVIRERLSLDTIRLIQDLVTHLAARGTEGEVVERTDAALQLVAAISGLMGENVNRVAGWRFLDMGRRIERAAATCRFAATFAGEAGPAEGLDILLDLVDSQITYRSRYLIGVALDPVRDLAVLDPFNPRSVAFQVEQLGCHIAALPAMRVDGLLEPPHRLVRRLAAKVETAEAQTMDAAQLNAIEAEVLGLAGAIADRYFLQGATAARADRWAGLA
ncbi:circularly permuted type 2 ATP-grasp protein [Lichenihabitans sp. Uapishka_5]|uniref:circularly permuted type 2 ATP-grasp protein n=1 Tax=Lichenihabitans sp. Uapishka_5 TaxID=3037302 RepID=UPI0029E7EEFE|nr:circularly permuted type 2 ATP-grasp protein [Lichenihabitans sp. Uapishka_5]MDX7952968.1 circularly permuted type 2 ATP-grasp protein [Lichenihabitans sp. Uapishka_5]